MKIIRNVIVVLVIALCAMMLVVSALHRTRQRLTHRIRTADQQAVLAACRQMIAVATNAPPPSKLPERSSDELQSFSSTDPSYTKVVPRALLELGPRYVVVRRDYAIACFSVVPRVSILAFADGANQFGDEQLTDGLWLLLTNGIWPKEDQEEGQQAN